MICIIPARGGSKRLPRKNILRISGRPLFYYPATAAIKSGIFEGVYISTEDAEISKLAELEEFKVIPRKADLASDTATVADVCLDFLKSLPIPPDYFACIYPTAVFLTAEHIINASKLLENNDFVMGVSKFPIHPWKAIDINSNPLFPEKIHKQLNDAPVYYGSNGTVYMAKTEVFFETRTFLSKPALIETPSVDIDTMEDFLNAKRILEPQGF